MTPEDHDEESVPARWTVSKDHPDMWVDPADDPRPSDDSNMVDERTTLLEYLRGYRLTLEMKCAGLDPSQLARRSVPPSTMSLLGLVRHMAEVERGWFRRAMAREKAPHLYYSDENPEGDWEGAVADPAVVADAWTAWRNEVEYAERYVDATPDLGTAGRSWDGSPIQLRSVLVHMIEEYARHCGHADLLRERVDGRVGQ
jgi:hypothetical protein